MKKIQRLLFVVSVLLGFSLLVSCSKEFSIDGMWKSSSGTAINFNNGTVSASLFGFDGGPDGSYVVSEKPNNESYYTLSASHVTGGTVEYEVAVSDNDNITLTSVKDNTFAPNFTSLERQ